MDFYPEMKLVIYVLRKLYVNKSLALNYVRTLYK